MIPQFPQFKELEISDQKDVEKFTSNLPPYSDFNFVSLWSWDIEGEMRLSILNDNLVVHFTDYLNGKPFYSFWGNNKVNETAEELLEFSKKKNLQPILKLIPEIMIKNFDLKKYHIDEEPDQFDYVYKTENLAHFPGSKFKNKRYLFNKFKDSYPNVRILISSTVDDKTKEDILKLDKRWARHKLENIIHFDIKNEIRAAEKFFISLPDFSDSKFLFLCIYVGEELAGFSISSIISEDYVVCHFNKGDIKYVGIYEYMLKNYAENLINVAHFINYEQDLGLPSLRFSKNSFRPSFFLKKYFITKI